MKSDELDKILDNALSSYSREEPRPGLEGRVLNRIREARERRRLRWLHWALATPVFACLLLAVTFWTTRDPAPNSRKPAPIVAKATPAPPPIATETVQTTVTRRRLKPLHLPKREQFPTPAPLTAEERALLAFVVHSPKQAQQLLADTNSHTMEPLQIKEIQIEPLHNGGE
jgi:hypothetical protein